MKTSERKAPKSRSKASKARKNARPSDKIVVVPDTIEGMRARIGEPFPALDLRQLVHDARQANPANPDLEFHRIIREQTKIQINALIARIGLNPDAPDYREAFLFLAIALCDVGHVVWEPSRRAAGRTEHELKLLYWLVTSFTEQDGISERAAIRKIATDVFLNRRFRYRPQDLRHDAKSSGPERRIGALRQVWSKAKLKKAEFTAAGPPAFLEDLLGGTQSHWENTMIALDIKHAHPKAGKKGVK